MAARSSTGVVAKAVLSSPAPRPSKFSFPKALRLLSRRQFLQRSEKRHVGKWIIIDMRANGLSRTRLGITVVKRYGKAHERNRFKRIVREAFRLTYGQLPPGFDLNIKPRSEAHGATSLEIQEELLRLLASK